MRPATEANEVSAKPGAVPGAEIPPDDVRAALDKILASPGFANADRLSRFLRYAVESALQGQPDKLKETLLGIEVFGRKPTYDPRIDAVVRTEAVKLRSRLKEYYETEGAADRVCIDMLKGGYVPAFRLREETPEVPPAGLSLSLEPAGPGDSFTWKSITAGLIVTVVLAASIWMAARKTPGPEGGAAGASIAVLPFADLSPGHDQEYFCDGMTEEIIDALAKTGGMRVVARTSSFAFKGKQQDIREIGRQLNVSTVLEGSVRKFGNKLRVTAQLNSVADGYHLWSETYERELKDVFSVQDEISQAIVATLELKLAGHNQPRAKAKTDDLETYDLYLKGRYHWARWRAEGAEKAIQYFEQAIARDPAYAPAYAGLADSYCWLGFFSALPPKTAMPKAKLAAERAIQLDDSLAAAHTSLAYVKALYDFDFPGADREFKRAMELNPGLAAAHFGYGIVYLAPMGRMPEAIREMKKAKELDPLSLATNTYLGLAYVFDGKLDQGIDQFKKALELDPDFFEARAHLASAYCEKRMFREFRAQLVGGTEPQPASRVELNLAFGDALEGNREQALATAHKWERTTTGTYVRPTSISNIYAALGDQEETLAWLEKAYADRDGMLAYVGLGRVYSRYHSNPRYQALMAKMGLPH